MIRFTDEEAKRIEKLLRGRRLTMQAFGHAAIMRALNEGNLGKTTDAELERDLERQERREQREVAQGLGIRDRIRSEDDSYERPRRDETPTTTVQPQQFLPPPRTIDDTIIALARAVVEAPKASRAEVLRANIMALTRGCSKEEALRLADDLDTTIRRLDGGAPQTALDRVRARMAR